MKLYIMRHGQALSMGEAKVDSDAERPLSQEGFAGVLESAKHLLAQGANPPLILHSPMKRAIQTATIVAEVLKPSKGVEAFCPLSNVLPPQDLFAELKCHLLDLEEAMVVGHQPQLGELTLWLTGKLVQIPPGGLVALEIRGDHSADLLWSRNP
jgi:phosphohistidine phosphatase